MLSPELSMRLFFEMRHTTNRMIIPDADIGDSFPFTTFLASSVCLDVGGATAKFFVLLPCTAGQPFNLKHITRTSPLYLLPSERSFCKLRLKLRDGVSLLSTEFRFWHVSPVF